MHFIWLLLFHLDGQGGATLKPDFGRESFSANFTVQGVFAPLPPLPAAASAASRQSVPMGLASLASQGALLTVTLRGHQLLWASMSPSVCGRADQLQAPSQASQRPLPGPPPSQHSAQASHRPPTISYGEWGSRAENPTNLPPTTHGPALLNRKPRPRGQVLCPVSKSGCSERGPQVPNLVPAKEKRKQG